MAFADMCAYSRFRATSRKTVKSIRWCHDQSIKDTIHSQSQKQINLAITRKSCAPGRILFVMEITENGGNNEKENAILAKRAEAGEKISIGRQLEQNKIFSEYNELLRFVDSLPDDIKRQVRAQEQQKHKITRYN